MREVTLEEVLAAKDARVARQQRLLAAWGVPVVSVTMNSPGPVKASPLIGFAFRETMEALRERVGPAVLGEELADGPAGPEAVLACAMPAGELKVLAMELEEAQPVGRLRDLDVIGADGQKLSRTRQRACLVCGGPAAACARSRAHGLEAVCGAADMLLREFAAKRLGELGVEALAAEVELTPKPGLVDQRNSGAHRDMDRALFLRSAKALEPYFRQASALGLAETGCMAALQQAGLEAERVMLAATGGVNTHKGAVYAFGILLASLGALLARGGSLWDTAAALAAAGTPPAAGSNGGEMCRLYGASGARGEALEGYPHVRQAWAVLRERGAPAALLTLLAEVEDTNLLYRGGMEGLRFVQRQAAEILAGPEAAFASRLEALDDACICRNLSPGGSADLLAAAFLLHRTEEIWLST